MRLHRKSRAVNMMTCATVHCGLPCDVTRSDPLARFEPEADTWTALVPSQGVETVSTVDRRLPAVSRTVACAGRGSLVGWCTPRLCRRDTRSADGGECVCAPAGPPDCSAPTSAPNAGTASSVSDGRGIGCMVSDNSARATSRLRQAGRSWSVRVDLCAVCCLYDWENVGPGWSRQSGWRAEPPAVR